MPWLRVLAVGRAVPEAAVGAGAVATQALCNMTYRPRGIEMLRRGMSAGETVAALLEHDDQREHRQVGIVDRDGGSASHSGSQCLHWAGGVTGPGYAIQGNILAGEQVVLAMQRAWLAGSEDEPFGRRLGAVLLAGDRAGGDQRGRQSAAILVVTQDGAHEARRTAGNYDIDNEHTNLRVDDHPDPVFELPTVDRASRRFGGARGTAEATRLDGDLLSEVQILLDRIGFRPSDGGVARSPSGDSPLGLQRGSR